ncbi:hypothetical protein LMJ53_16690 [Rheinheimera sp. UJ51]|uniref:hypothetical protein n=1 Tax=Rheinheimera sp. UJ51 TaxID=2892446 RepID=UPI001E45ABE9|nr:hypothetical protein [Rheinheimera sp. UJ51]MCC5453354.1 hypothetical protein [Rheinheimera sp. UJ51]
MGFIVVDTTIYDEHNFHIIQDDSSLIEWHMNEFGHFYKIFSSEEEIKDFFNKYDFEDSYFEDEAKKIFRKSQSVIITSCSPNQSHFIYAVKCRSKEDVVSEVSFIINECPILCETDIHKREVFDFNYILDSYKLESPNIKIRHSMFGAKLFCFLEKNNFLLEARDKYWIPDINENPHKPAVLSTYLFRQHYEESNLGIMEYWNYLHSNDRKYCRDIAKKINSTRDEWESEISE